ncbi:hypothetical protein U3516DRAFT_347 [Neocallimastix sp. 'constans']
MNLPGGKNEFLSPTQHILTNNRMLNKVMKRANYNDQNNPFAQFKTGNTENMENWRRYRSPRRRISVQKWI